MSFTVKTDTKINRNDENENWDNLINKSPVKDNR